MGIEWCSSCRGVIFDSSPHKCPPKWRCWTPEDDETPDDGRTLHAVDPEEAAKKCAEEDDSYDCDYAIAGRGETATIHVMKQSDYSSGEWFDEDDDTKIRDHIDVHKFVISGETIPTYYAREAE